MTAPAIATVAGRLIVTSAANTVAQRQVSQTVNNTSGTTASTSFTATLSGGGTSPAVTVTTGTSALIFLNSTLSNGLGFMSFASYAISGATTSAAIEGRSIQSEATDKDDRMGVTNLFASLDPGSNTFTMQYKVNANTGTFTRRSVVVMAL